MVGSWYLSVVSGPWSVVTRNLQTAVGGGKKFNDGAVSHRGQTQMNTDGRGGFTRITRIGANGNWGLWIRNRTKRTWRTEEFLLGTRCEQHRRLTCSSSG